LPSFPIFSDNPFTGRQRPPPVALGQGQRPVSGGMWRSARELGLLLVLLALGALGAPTTIDKSVWDGRTINIGALDIDGKVESKLGATYKVREPLPPRRTTPSGTTRTPGGITASTISFFSVLLAVDTDQEALELPPLRPAIMPPGCIDTSLGMVRGFGGLSPSNPQRSVQSTRFLSGAAVTVAPASVWATGKIVNVSLRRGPAGLPIYLCRKDPQREIRYRREVQHRLARLQ